LALNVLANAYGNSLHLQIAADRKHALREATSAAMRAIELDGDNSLGYALRALCIYHDGQVERYSDAVADARRAYELNPNDTIVRQVLGQLETVVGEPKRAIEHLKQVLRLNPRQPRRHITYNMLAHASFGAEEYVEGSGWASRAINERPEYPPPHLLLAICLVGMGEIDKAKAAFTTGQKLSPEFFETRLKGTPAYARPQDRKRADTFLRIAAGLEDPSAADTLR
jgi:tetratricopeptide (TPR) repeat protein